MKQAGNILSYIFHPVFMPTAGLYIVLNYALASDLGNRKTAVYLISFIFTFLLPVITILFFRWFKLISSVHMPYREERRLPVLITVAMFFLAYHLIKKGQFHPLLDLIMISSVFTLIMVSVVNFYYKLSIHMAALASLTAMLTALSILPSARLELPLTIAIFSSGLTGFARLAVKAHTSGEVFAGYAVGFLSQYFVLMMLIVRVIR